MIRAILAVALMAAPAIAQEKAVPKPAAAPELAALDLKLGFFKLVVRDVAANTAFFQKTFGFEVRNRIELPGIVEVVMALPGQNFSLVLYHNTDGRAVTLGDGYGPVGFTTVDVDAAYARALANGATALRAPFDLGPTRLAFVRGPEGHTLELIQRPKD